MSGEKQSTNQSNCEVQGHEQKAFIAVCISSNCKNAQKLICSKCFLDGLHNDHINEILYIKDFVEYNGTEIFDIPLWKKEGENIFNQVSDWMIEQNQGEREEKITVLFSAFKKNINLLIDEAEKKYKERLGRDSEILLDLTQKFLELSPISIISEKCKQLYDNVISKDDFELFLQEKIITKPTERKSQVQELEELFKDIRDIEESLNFKNLSKQLIKELPQLLRADSFDVQSPLNSLNQAFSKVDSINSDNNDHHSLPTLNKQASSVSKREQKKIILLGKSNIGKSTLINTLIHREFQPDISAHIKRNMSYGYEFNSNLKKYLFTIQEISGDEQITNESKTLLKNVNIVVLLYDSEESLDALDQWVNMFIEFGVQANQHITFPFVLTQILKNDDANQVQQSISEEKVNHFMSDHAINSKQIVDITSLNSINSFLDNIASIL